jgi:hypothetical protein
MKAQKKVPDKLAMLAKNEERDYGIYGNNGTNGKNTDFLFVPLFTYVP